MGFFDLFRKRISSYSPRERPSAGTSPSPSKEVTLPDGHEATIYRPEPIPSVHFSDGGVCIAFQGTASDEPVAEIDRLLRDAREAAQGNRSQIFLATDAGRASDLFAPADPQVTRSDGLQLWVLNPPAFVSLAAGATVLQTLLHYFYSNSARGVPQVAYVPELTSPDGLLIAELVHGLGVMVREYDSDTGAVLFEVRRPEGVILSALPGRSFNPESITQYAYQINEQKNDAEEQGDIDRLQHLEEQEREELASRLAEVQGKATRSVTRAPYLCRLLLKAQDDAEGAWQELYNELLQRDTPLLVLVDPETGAAAQRTWPGKGAAIPAYPDGASLRQAGSDLGIPIESLAFAEMLPRDLFSWLGQQNSAVAINVYRDGKTPLYVWLQAETVQALSEGKVPLRRSGRRRVAES